MLSKQINAKREQWAMEALLFNAAAGKNGQTFKTTKWANGQIMVGPVGCRCNQEIPVAEFERLKANNWLIINGNQ